MWSLQHAHAVTVQYNCDNELPERIKRRAHSDFASFSAKEDQMAKIAGSSGNGGGGSQPLVSRGQTFRGKGTSGHYCQHFVDNAGMLG